jgi:hypothetical protein
MKYLPRLLCTTPQFSKLKPENKIRVFIINHFGLKNMYYINICRYSDRHVSFRYKNQYNYVKTQNKFHNKVEEYQHYWQIQIKPKRRKKKITN